MAHAEIELISNIVDTGDWREVSSSGLVPDHFMTDEGFMVFDWLFEEFKKDKHVPDRTRFLRKWPSFEWAPTDNPIKSLIREVRQNGIRAKARQILEEMGEDLDAEDDPMDALMVHLSELRDLTVDFAEPDGMVLSKSAKAMQADYEITENSSGVVGIPYPWAPLNEATSGMLPGQFIIFFARPKQMKTFTALKVATDAYLEHGKRVAVYSKEMTVKQMMGRAAADIAGLPYGKLKGAKLTPEEKAHYFDVLDGLAEMEEESAREAALGGATRRPAMMFLSDKGVRGGSTPESLRARVEKFEPDLLMVDGFYLMRDARSKKKDRDWKTVSNISADIKEMAIEMDIPIIGTTQANRGAEKDAKHLAADDLSGLAFADAIGQDGDVIIQLIKGKAAETGKPALLLLFPGIRDAEIQPFVINADPGVDFSLRSRRVNIKAFIEEAKKLWAEEEEAEAGASGGTTKKDPVRKKPKEPKRSAGGLRS